jgi:hypothetical protein
MSTPHGTAPMGVGEFKTLSGVLVANVPILDSELSRELSSNGDAVAIILKRAMTRENLDAVLIELGKKEKPEPPSPPKPLKATLDTNALPELPAGFNLTAKDTKHQGMGTVKVEKRADGQLYVNGVRVVRYLSSNQQNGKVIRGHKLRLEIEDDGKQYLNATLRNFLLANPKFIPDDWEGATYFWDTISANADGSLCVACLYRGEGRWLGRWGWLDVGWDSREPAARLAS